MNEHVTKPVSLREWVGVIEAQLRSSKVKVAELCEDCVDLIRAQASKKELIVSCEIGADVPELEPDARASAHFGPRARAPSAARRADLLIWERANESD